MRRYLEFSNQAPVYTMWQVLEPQIESVRRRLAASFGCDPEELAITRNQRGPGNLHLRPGPQTGR